MKNKIFTSFDEAVADIPNGVTIMFPGFGVGIATNLTRALHRQGAKDLTGISNHHGDDGEGDLGIMVEAGRFRKLICAFTAPTHPSQVAPFTWLYNEDQIEAELVPQGTLAERIRSAASGIGGFYTPASVGTELAKGKEHREINGRTYVLEYPLHADYAFIRAWMADTMGNLQFRLTQRNFNPIMAMAAKTTIVEVENCIVEPGGIDPDYVHVPSVYVDRMVLIPDDGI